MTTKEELRYERVVVKVSGESLGSEQEHLDPEKMADVARSVASIQALGLSVAVVVGGGNLFRGGQSAKYGMEKPQADAVGMLATGMNVLILQGLLSAVGVTSKVFSRGPCSGIGHAYDRQDVLDALAYPYVVLLAGGMGISGVSTDVAAVHAAVDLGADAVIMAKYGVDGVYDADPRRDASAAFLPKVTASEALERHLQVMDSIALGLARDNKKSIHVVAASDPYNIKYLIEGKDIGSTISPI